jgi:hypothetical protein
MASSGPNRVLIGLPDRLSKAREQIAIFEKRFEMIRDVINAPTPNSDVKLARINGITRGDYDPR